MFLAILCYNVTHPGSILVGPEAALPGLWGMVKERMCCGMRRRNGKMVVDDDGHELISKYAVLGDDNAPSR
jgi:hypothetical protein